MKKLTLLIGILFLLTSCYSNPKDLEKIEELEKTNIELKEDIQNITFERNKECGLLDKEIKDYLFDPQYLLKNLDPQVKEVFYSPKRKSCLVVYSYQGYCEDNTELCPQKDRVLLDFFTKEELEKENSSTIDKLVKCTGEDNSETRFDDCNRWWDFDTRLKTYK